MRERNFEIWLERWYRTANDAPLDPATRGSRFSTTRRIDHALGDLDTFWSLDKGKSVLAKFRYSRGDASRSIPPKHGIRIDGDAYNGTATLRRSLVLYFQFCAEWPANASSPVGTPPPPTAPDSDRQRRRRGGGAAVWPSWPVPADDDLLALARALSRHARFLQPDLVAALVEDNERRSADWAQRLLTRGVDSAAYLWDRGACAFPGVRRYAGSAEIAEFHGHRAADPGGSGALVLDDNSFPKHMWSFVLRGRPFQQFGPGGYALAHLADHKEHGNRVESEVSGRAENARGVVAGLFTSPTNTAYLPTSLIKPTDHAAAVRNLLLRRAQALYGKIANLFPPPYTILEGPNAEWDLEKFTWCDPVGTPEHLGQFLVFRAERMEELLAGNALGGRTRKKNLNE